MAQSLFEWTWLALLITATAVRKAHEHKVGRRASLRGIPLPEAGMMVLWGVAAGVLPLLYLFSPWLDFADYPFDVPLALSIVGVALFVCAIWLLHRSHADLGRQWSPAVEFQDDHVLVTEGAYEWVRHPMYAAHLLWGLAQTLLLPNFVAGPWAFVLMIGITAMRIPREERAMKEQFGDAYQRYRARTGGIVPRWIANRGRPP
jgi:protein-S-isoprenylcysteine O-methyltransferase Ste14